MMDKKRRAQLDSALLSAHEKACPLDLMNAYNQAAEAFDAHGDEAAAAFFKTHALVFALEAGSAKADGFGQWLATRGRM
jgi:hypothetical protein